MFRKKAFTLIELLVVIAIVALLMGILIPMLSKAKMYAQEILCKSNLHQYSIATEMYCNESDDKLPPSWASLYNEPPGGEFNGEVNRYCRWHNPDFNLQANQDKQDGNGRTYAGPYWPYLSVTKANVCPTFATIAPKYGQYHLEGTDTGSSRICIGGPYIPNFSYSMNTIFGGDGRKSQCKSPSKTFMWAEENMWVLTGLSDEVLNDNALLVAETKSNIVDSFGSYHKISTAQLELQRDTNRYVTDTGVANILMVDGSSKWATPEESWWYRGKNL